VAQRYLRWVSNCTIDGLLQQTSRHTHVADKYTRLLESEVREILCTFADGEIAEQLHEVAAKPTDSRHDTHVNRVDPPDKLALWNGCNARELHPELDSILPEF